MKYRVKRFKSLAVALKELERYIRNGEHLQTGKPFKRFGAMRSREALANWLMCVAVNHVSGEGRLTFTSDPTGGDGIIYDTVTGETWRTEHTLVPRARSGEAANIEARILQAVVRKQSKGGAAYAAGKTLVIFLNASGGPWLPTNAARKLPSHNFDAVWVVGVQGVEDGLYVYAVTRLDVSRGQAPVWRVRIDKDFDAWTVEPVQ